MVVLTDVFDGRYDFLRSDAPKAFVITLAALLVTKDGAGTAWKFNLQRLALGGLNAGEPGKGMGGSPDGYYRRACQGGEVHVG